MVEITNFSDVQVPFDDDTNHSDGEDSFFKSNNLSDGGYSRTFDHHPPSTEEIPTDLTMGGGSVDETTFSDGGGSQTIEETALEMEEEKGKSQTEEEIEGKEDSG